MSKVLAVILAVCVVVCAAVGIGVYVYTNDETTEPQIPSDPPTELPTEEPITPPEEPPTEIPTEPPIEIPEGDFTVTFMMNCIDGGVYLTEYVDDGETVVEPEVPEKPKENYLFVKWTTDKENRYAYDFLTPVTADLVLYADWDVMGTSSGSGHSHNWEETSVTEATCVADGERTFTCSCGQTKTETIPATGEHSYTENVKQPTCVEEGEAFCICGDKQTTPPTGHSVVENKEDGTFAPKCSVCDEEYQAMLSTQGNVKTYHTKVAYAFANASAEDGLHTIHLAADMDSRIALDKAVIISSHKHKVNLSCTNVDDIKILKDGCTFKVIGDTSVATNVDVTLQSGEKISLISDDDNEYLEPIQPDEWDGTADTSWYNDSYTEFTLTSAEQIAGLASLAGTTDDFAGKTINLLVDVDLSGHGSFAPIGTTGEKDDRDRLITEPFKGTFDGNGHTISNLYQSGWDFGYMWGKYGSIGLFSELEGATVKNVVLDGFECQVEGGDIAFIAGSATGDCKFENIEIKSGNIGTYNNGIGGIIGWSGVGTYTFKDITIGEDVVIGGLWGSFDSSIGGVVGQAEPGATYKFENVDVACRLDAYNDVTAAYKYYLYRMTGMLIGRMEETTTIDGKNYPDTTKYNIKCKEVTVTYNDWANYHYCVVSGKTAWRHEPGFTYGGIPANHDHSTCDPTMHNLELPFDGLFGGAQYGVNPITAYEGVTVIYNNK